MTGVGREIIQVVEIRQPFCARSFGVAPCSATGSADARCYNTRATCLDPANFALGAPLRLFFSRGHVAEQGIADAPYVIPSLVSVSTSPTRINLAGASLDAQGLGNRALCRVTFQDHQHTDRVVDPYVDGRSWNPLSADRGTFWTRWLVRNLYRQNVEIIVYEGYAGQALVDMQSRMYFLERVSGPDSSGRITIEGKDVLARIEERKAQAPIASPGVLLTAVTASQTSLTAAGAIASEYDASGVLRIGDEIMRYSGRSTVAGGVAFSGISRGQFGTVARAHAFNDAVQQCVAFTNIRADSLVFELLTRYGGVNPAYLDVAGWAGEFDSFMSFYLLDVLIPNPEAVTKIVSEVAEQVGFYLWWDERARLVRMRAIRGITQTPKLLTEGAHILADSFSLQEMPRQRSSQVWVHFSRLDHLAASSEVSSYRSLFVAADLESETDALYGEPSYRRIYARFLSTQVLAQSTASKLLVRYVETPRACSFALDGKDRDLSVGDTVRISHHLDCDAFGRKRLRNWTITSIDEKLPGEMLVVTAEDTTLYGEIALIMADGSVDYNPDGNNPIPNLFIGDGNGRLSDGRPSGRIS